MGGVVWDSSLLFAHDLEGGLVPWVDTSDNANWAIARLTVAAYRGRFGLRVATGAAVFEPVGEGSATARVPNGFAGRCGLSVFWRLLRPEVVSYIAVRFDGARAEQGYGVGVKFDVVAGAWYVLGSVGTWSAIAGGAQDLNLAGWHRVVVVVDWGVGEYVRVISDERSLNVAGVGYESTADGSNTGCDIKLAVSTIDGTRAGCYFDEVVLCDGDVRRYG